MSLVPSLLQAIVRVDGEALVMHAGDKPYVVSPTGQVDLASRGLTLDAVNGIVSQLLPIDLQNALEEFGAVQHELGPMAEFPGEHFTIVAARGGDDVWAEIRRRRIPEDDRVPDEFFVPSPTHAAPQDVAADAAAPHAPAQIAAAVSAIVEDDDELPIEMLGFDPPAAAASDSRIAESAPLTSSDEALELDDDLLLPDAGHLWPGQSIPGAPAMSARLDEEAIDIDVNLEEIAPVAPEPEPVREPEPLPEPMPEPVRMRPAAHVIAPPPPAPVPVVAAAPAVAAAADPVAPPPPIVPVAPPIAASIELPPHAAPIAAAEPPPLAVIAAEMRRAQHAPIPTAIEAPQQAPLPHAEEPPIAASIEAPPHAAPIAATEPPPLAVIAAERRPAQHAPIATAIEAPQQAPLRHAEEPPIAASIEAPPHAAPIAATEPPPLAVIAAEMGPAQHAPIATAIEAPQQEPLRHAEEPPIAASIEAPPHAAVIAASVPPPQTSYQPPIAASVEPAPPMRSVAPPLRHAQAESQPAVVLNIARNPIRSEIAPPPVEDPTLFGLERLLRVSSARGASTLYLSSESRPSVRVDGELQLLDGEPIHVARDVESLLLTLMPERSHEALRTGAATEWICDLDGVGRVRCMSFRDQRGPGGVFRLMPTRSVSADQLGLPKQVQALAIEPEGLVLVAGPRSSGKRTTMSAFVDLMNRTRRDHIITIEREINIQHERGQSFISQREVRGSDEDVLAAARAAMREDPDVLVIEELRTGALMNVALEAAAAGRLVVGGFTAHTATGAVDRIIDLYAPEYHRQVQMALADSMRGVIAQALLRKVGGGRLPAREVLLNTPAVSSAIAEGKTSQLPMAIEGGRRYGMMPLNDALVGLVQNGSVEAREAYRHSPDRPGFLAALNRQGIDTTFVERLANG